MFADIVEIAESIDDVRGIPRAIAALCSGTEDIGGVVVGCLLFSFVTRTGSDVLLEDALIGLEDGSDLEGLDFRCSCKSGHKTYLFCDAEDIAMLFVDS